MSQSATAIIATAAKLRSGDPAGSFVAERSETVAQIDLIHLAAKSLLDMPDEQRLSEISNMLDSFATRESGEFWIRHDAARSLVDLLGDVASVRFAFPASLRPALLFAFKNRIRATSGYEIEYAGWQRDGLLLRQLAQIFDLHICIRESQPLTRTDGLDFDAEVIMPPFGFDMSRDAGEIPQATLSRLGVVGSRHGRLSCETVAIADALQHARGRVILTVGEGALYRAVGVEAFAREELVRSGRLQAVMSMGPSMMFSHSSINSSVVIVAPEETHLPTVRFINLAHEQLATRRERGRLEIRPDADWLRLTIADLSNDEPYAKDVSVATIKAEGFTLTSERYLEQQARDAINQFLNGYEVAELMEVVEMIRPAPVTQQDGGEYTILEAAPSDIGDDGYLSKPSRCVAVDQAQHRKASNQQVRPGDIVIAFKGTVGKVGMVPKEAPEDGASTMWTAGQSLMILRPKGRKELRPCVLFEYLSDEVVQEYLRALAGGSAIQTIAMKDLKSVAVPLPNLDEQSKIESEFEERQILFRQIEALKGKIVDHQRASWPHAALRS